MSNLQELGDLDRSNKVGRTSVQVGIPAAIVGIGSWLARLADLDLDPGAGRDLPADVAGYFVAVIALVLAATMNRAPKPDDESGQSVLVMAAVAGIVCVLLLLAFDLI